MKILKLVCLLLLAHMPLANSGVEAIDLTKLDTFTFTIDDNITNPDVTIGDIYVEGLEAGWMDGKATVAITKSKLTLTGHAALYVDMNDSRVSTLKSDVNNTGKRIIHRDIPQDSALFESVNYEVTRKEALHIARNIHTSGRTAPGAAWNVRTGDNCITWAIDRVNSLGNDGEINTFNGEDFHFERTPQKLLPRVAEHRIYLQALRARCNVA